MGETDIIVSEQDIIKMEPTQIIKIAVGDLSAPVATGVELSKLAEMEKLVFLDLLTHSERDEETGKLIIDPNALDWGKEYKKTLKIIHDLTKGVQEKAMLKKMDVAGALYKSIIKNNKPQDVIKMIKQLQKEEENGIITTSD